MEETVVFNERKEKALSWLRAHYSWITYLVLAAIVYLAVWIRTRNLDRLRDITTGGWTLGPDLDPFLFLRWSKYIVEHGSLMAVDTMRYVPLGFNTKVELILHPYMMAWFHKVAVMFGSSSVEQSAVFYPVFMFALTVVAFFLLARKVFIKKVGKINANIIGLISALLLTLSPSLLPRTIAGIPEKESAAFLFMFMSFYLFITAWESKSFRNQMIFAVLAGMTTAGMALIWGGYAYIFITIALAVMVSFILGKVDNNKIYMYAVWIATSFVLMWPFSVRYALINLVTGFNSGPAAIVLFILLIHLVITKTSLVKYYERGKLAKVPKEVLSLIVGVIVLLALAAIILGPSYITSQVNDVLDNLITPANSRLIQTVAENRQPYFTEWGANFGPVLGGVPLFFWLFFVASVYLFYHAMSSFPKKEKGWLTSGFTLLLVCIIFSRYSAASSLNGTNNLSLFVYFCGIIAFLAIAGLYYYKSYNSEKTKLHEVEFTYIFLLSLLFLSIISARGAVRLIMMLVPPTAMIASYFLVSVYRDTKNAKSSNGRYFVWAVLIIAVISSLLAAQSFYTQSVQTAEVYAPSTYTQQWQKAMSWVRENTPQNAVFAHWWDYGYWLQSIGNRATVLDGGNSISYWNHLMGRYALTGKSNTEALEFLYAHKVTHFLIDSTDLGKYSAFSLIGSDTTYDRSSWLPTLMLDTKQTQEKKNSTLFVYPAGFTLDEDLMYEENGTKIILPAGKAGIAGVFVERDKQGRIMQPRAIFVYQKPSGVEQYSLPLRYVYDKELIDFNSGVEAGVFLMPRLDVDASGGGTVLRDGALTYLSARTVNSQLARLYLYDENNPNFELVHSEDSELVKSVRSQQPDVGDFVYYQGIQGPIKIWEVSYPSDITLKEEYLKTDYPLELVR